MFNDNEIVDDEDEDEYYVTQLPGSDYEMEFDKDQDWMEYNIPVLKQQHKANLDLVPSSLLVAKSVNGNLPYDCSRYYSIMEEPKPYSIDDAYQMEQRHIY
jgi:hypothetical protein